MSFWSKDIAAWEIGKTLYLSVPFTWLLPKARSMALSFPGPVQAGGPAVQLMPDFLADVAAVNQPCPVEPLIFHNKFATFTSRGCPNNCAFCAVPKLEGDLVELDSWRPAPIICDNNLLATSQRHFDRVIDRLKLIPSVDFNQGLEARLLTPYHAARLAELKKPKIRFAFDHVNEEAEVAEAVNLCRRQGLKDFGVYVLIGFNDTPDDAYYRLEKIRQWGIRPNPMRYQPLNALSKNEYIAPGWTDRELKDMMHHYGRLRYTEHIPYKDRRHPTAPLFER
jgi:Lysine 2,3-aminomutase